MVNFARIEVFLQSRIEQTSCKSSSVSPPRISSHLAADSAPERKGLKIQLFFLLALIKWEVGFHKRVLCMNRQDSFMNLGLSHSAVRKSIFSGQSTSSSATVSGTMCESSTGRKWWQPSCASHLHPSTTHQQKKQCRIDLPTQEAGIWPASS